MSTWPADWRGVAMARLAGGARRVPEEAPTFVAVLRRDSSSARAVSSGGGIVADGASVDGVLHRVMMGEEKRTAFAWRAGAREGKR